MTIPLVSVIIPSFNRFKFLLNAIESVQNQNFNSIEIIVINDGSTDSNYLSYEFDSNVKLIHLEKNQKEINGFGPGAIRNFGTNKATGKYLAFLDDDDIWLDNKLNIQISTMQEGNYKLSSTEGLFGFGPYNPDEKYKLYHQEHYWKDLKFIYKKTKYLKQGLPKIWDYEFINIHNCFITSSVVVEKKLFDTLGGFRGLPLWADYDCWLGLLKMTNSIFINKPLVYYDGGHADGRNYKK
jgi:glycosyltransferase involved in cell wall biosynthesis